MQVLVQLIHLLVVVVIVVVPWITINSDVAVSVLFTVHVILCHSGLDSLHKGVYDVDDFLTLVDESVFKARSLATNNTTSFHLPT